jgi:hypothetical protein
MSLVHDYISVQKAVETANLETEYQVGSVHAQISIEYRQLLDFICLD